MEAPLINSIDSADLSPAAPAKLTIASRVNGIVSWIMSLWLILMTGWYVKTAVDALEHPLAGGDDITWVWAWIWFAVAVILSHLLVRRRLITFIWLGLLTAVAIAMIALSHQIGAALITVWLLLLSWAWGDWTLRRMGMGRSPLDLERAVVSLPLGLALLGLVALALCLTQRLTSKWAWVIFLALTLVQGRSLLKLGLACRRLFVPRRGFAEGQPVGETGIIVVLLGFVFLRDLSWALAPDRLFDALSAHLPTAKYYVEHPVAWLAYGYVANLANLLFALALSLQGQIVAKLLVLASSVITTLGVYAFGRVLFSARVGVWAAALFFSTPLVSWLSGTAYVDAVVTMFLLTSLFAFFRWREDRQRGWLWASGLLMGAALAVKLNALLGLPVIGLILLWDLIRSRQPARARLKSLAGYILGIGLVAAPGFALAYSLTGNPFHPIPLLDKLLKSPAGPAISLISNSDLFGVGTSPTSLVNLPFAFTFETQKFGEAMPAGAVGLALVLAPLALATVAKGSVLARRAAMLLAVCLVYVGCLAYTMQYGRYYIPVLPIVAILAVAPLVHFSKSKWLRRVNLTLLGVVFSAQVALSPLMYWNFPERFPIALVLGKETEESYLLRAVALYPVAHYINKRTEKEQKVIGVGLESIRYYVNATIVDPRDLEGMPTLSTQTSLAARLVESGYTYLLINRSSPYSTMPLSCLSLPFLSQFTTLEYIVDNVYIYRLSDGPVDSGPPANLLDNPSFELLNQSSSPAGWVAIGKPRIAQSNTQSHTGKVAVLADPVNLLYAGVPVKSGEIYSFGHWTRADLPNQLARLQINWADERLKPLGASVEVVAAGPAWAWHQVSVLAPTGAVFAVVHVSVHENSEVWFDDFSFVRGQLNPQ